MRVSKKIDSTSHTLPSIETLRLLGGRLCLDFANTVDPRIGNKTRDLLVSYEVLVKWSLHATLLTKSEAQQLLNEASLHPIEATATWKQAITLREAIYSVFFAVAHQTTPEARDLEVLKNAFIEAMIHAQITTTSNGFSWEWEKQEGTLSQMLWPIVRSAMDLLTSEEVKRVKECPGLGDCGWLFLDTSKNGSRQWCSMEGCGSRAKMRQQYARKRASALRR